MVGQRIGKCAPRIQETNSRLSFECGMRSLIHDDIALLTEFAEMSAPTITNWWLDAADEIGLRVSIEGPIKETEVIPF